LTTNHRRKDGGASMTVVSSVGRLAIPVKMGIQSYGIDRAARPSFLSSAFCLLFSFLCLFSPAFARTITVKSDATGDYPTIQAAIDAAVTDDVINLQPGTYTGTGNRDIDFKGKAITVRGATGEPNDCVIKCSEGNCSCNGILFQSSEDSNSIVESVTIQGFREVSWSGGAGILCEN
jgi:hypothetical protein